MFDLPSTSYVVPGQLFNCTQHRVQIWNRNSARSNLRPRHQSDVCMRCFYCSINSLGRNEVSSLTVRLSFSPAVPKASPTLRTSDANDTGNLEVFLPQVNLFFFSLPLILNLVFATVALGILSLLFVIL